VLAVVVGPQAVRSIHRHQNRKRPISAEAVVVVVVVFVVVGINLRPIRACFCCSGLAVS